MALPIVSRWSWLPVVACIGLIQACGSKNGDDDDSGGGCSKDTDCINGRICENKQCVAATGGILGGGSGAGGSSGTTGGTGGTTGGAGGTGGSAGSGAMCAETDPSTCPTPDSMTLCIDGTVQTFTCDYVCATLGFPVGGCAPPDGCACDFTMPSDADCKAGATAACTCLASTTSPCVSDTTTNDLLSIYTDCHNNYPQDDADFVRCLGTKVMTSADCSAASTACAPPAQ